MNKLLLALIISFIPFAHAEGSEIIKNMAEVLRLPRYCWGTQQVRNISRDPKPIQEYLAIYGKSYYHMHHYCWALNAEYKASRILDKGPRESVLSYAVLDIQYSLDRTEPGFVFLPDMYTAKARILFKLHRDDEAVIALTKAIEAKPDYVFAIARLSDYFANKGDKAQAIKILEEGIDHTEHAATLIRKLEELGKTYQGTPGNARKQEEPAKEQIIPFATEANQGLEEHPTASSKSDAPATPEETTKQTQPLPTDSRPANNPYCRFCP